MRKLLCLLLLALLLPARAEAAAALLAKANADYLQGRYAAAAEGYRGLVAQGWRTGEVYYNLGNAYAKLGDQGRARVAYENALQLTPRDGDLRRNAGELAASLADKSPAPSNLELAASYFTRTELVISASFFYWVGAGLLLWQLKRKTATRTALLGVCALGVLVFGGLWVVRERSQLGEPAVVIPSEVSLYDGPGRDFQAGLKLHEGSLVYVLGSRGDWREVAALGRVQGWLRAEELEPVDGGSPGDR